MDKEVQYIYNIPKINRKSTLENTAYLLKKLDAYDTGAKIIHVAGTNGKGSVCAYLTEILMDAGYSVGTFISPHLVDINERIAYNGAYISNEDFEDIFKEVKEVSLNMEKEGHVHPSFFEFLFAMGMKYYAKVRPDYIILETGLGGRLDATNVFAKPELAIITSIGLDHTEILGDTIAKIAFEKAGIIKPMVPVVYWDAGNEASEVIMDVAAKKSAKAIGINASQTDHIHKNHKNIDFLLYNSYYDNVNFQIDTVATYQIYNAALAATAAAVLGIDRQYVISGIKKTHWIGRMQPLKSGMIIDGGHNDDGIREFLLSVAGDGATKSRTLLFSAVKDKHYEGMIEKICTSRLFDNYILAPLDDARGLDISEMERCFSKYNASYECCSGVKDAYKRALSYKNNKIYAVGSLYLVGEIIKADSKED